MPSNLPFSSGTTKATACAAPVLVGMMLTAAARARRQVRVRQVKNLLVVGITVNRCHKALLDTKGIVDNFGGWRQTIRRARSV